MLIPFTIDPDAISLDGEKSQSRKLAIYETFFDLWTQYGVLIIFDADYFKDSRLFNKIESLPDELRNLWSDQWRNNRIRCVKSSDFCQEINKLSDLFEAAANASVRVYGVSAGEFDAKFGRRDVVAEQNGIDICHFEFMGRSDKFRELTRTGILLAGKPQFDRRKSKYSDYIRGVAKYKERVWGRLFKEPAADMCSISVVDRYCTNKIFKSKPQDLNDEAGLYEFLHRLEASGKENNMMYLVDIYGGYNFGDKYTAPNIFSAVKHMAS